MRQVPTKAGPSVFLDFSLPAATIMSPEVLHVLLILGFVGVWALAGAIAVSQRC